MTVPPAPDDALRPLTDDVAQALVANYRRFLGFLEHRVADRAAAEEILQSALARALEKGIPADEPGAAVTWFFAVLRHALVDHYRRRGSEARAIAAFGAEAASAPCAMPAPDDEALFGEVCACFRALLPTLKPEYAAVLERVDLGGETVSAAADALGITANNASVRLHRARAALRRQLERSCGVCATHGCLSCSCGSAG